MSREATMREGLGERAERVRKRRIWLISGGLGLTGGVVGAALSYLNNDAGRALPLAWAVGVTLFYLFGLSVGSWLFFRQADEVEMRDNLIGSAVGIYFYAALYPGWYFLWKGGLVAEPDHQILFVGTMAAMAGAYSWKKIRP